MNLLKSKFLSTTIILIIISSIIVIFSGCEKSSVEVAKEEEYTPVKTEKVSKGRIEKSFTYSGYIEPIKEINVSSKSTGEVSEVFFDVGNKVKKGDILFVMDKKTAVNNLTSLENQLDTQVNQTESALKSSKIQYDDAKKNLEDMTALFNKGSISNQEFENTKVAYDQAKVAYETAQKSYELLFNNSSKSSLAAQIDIAKKNLQDLEVKSPLDGVVTQRNVEVGELAANNPAFKIADIKTVTLEINIPENMINKVNLDQKVNVNISSIGNTPFIGKITKISPLADNQILTYPISIEIENEDEIIKSGMYSETEIIGETNSDAIIIPRNSILLDGEQKYVYIFEEGIAKRLDLDTGIDNGIEIEVKKGLHEGQHLIVKGQSYLTDGEKISEQN